MPNVLENAVWIILVLIMLIGLGIGIYVSDRLFYTTTAQLNTTLANYNLTNTSNPTYNLTQDVYFNILPQYESMKTLWLEMIQFVIVMLVAFLFITSFMQNQDPVQYVYMFIASLFISAIISYLFTQIYNAVSGEFITMGISTGAFFSWFVQNYQLLLVFNILGFIANVVFQKLRQTSRGME
jgi:hypothetical protein